MVLICLFFRFVFCLMTLKLFIKCHFTFVVSYEAVCLHPVIMDLTVEQRFQGSIQRRSPEEHVSTVFIFVFLYSRARFV